jgi:hypothetical protein
MIGSWRKRTTLYLPARYADMLSAMGKEPRLRIVRLLLTALLKGW